ncbi:hypothetical protein DMI65_18535 [Escherichia coli]|nr:hypothetical protein [Escherichia coli]
MYWRNQRLKRLRTATFSSYRSSTKTCISPWMRDIQDWCISRQLWWGHRIPAWYDEAGNVYVGRNEDEVRKENNLGADVALRQDEDVLDTGSPPRCGPSTLGWPENTDALRQFHPTSVMVSGFDIIFFWIARMIMMTMHFIKDENGNRRCRSTPFT